MVMDSTGLLIIRTYLETDSSSPLRAEVRLTNDVSAGIERTLTLADSDVVVELVRAWLDGFVEGRPTSPAPHAALTH